MKQWPQDRLLISPWRFSFLCSYRKSTKNEHLALDRDRIDLGYAGADRQLDMVDIRIAEAAALCQSMLWVDT